MTHHDVILMKPTADTSVDYTLPEDNSASLNLNSEDISGLHIGDNGSLVISFENGGTLILTNFEEFSAGGNQLTLADGTFVDPSILTNIAQNPSVFDSAQTADADAIIIQQPGENTTQELALTEGQKYICDFDPSNTATVEIKDGQMILTFADGSQVVLNNYSEVMAGMLPPELTLEDGSVIDGTELLTEVTDIENLDEEVADVEPAAGEEEVTEEGAAEEGEGEEDLAALAEQLAAVQPASGETGGSANSGYGFNSTPNAVSLDSPDAIGPLGVTSLAYDAPKVTGNTFAQFDDQPVIPTVTEFLDETNLSGGNVEVSGTLNVNYGNDGPGAISVTDYTDVSNSVDNGIFTSHGVPIVITQTVDGHVGMAGGVTVFTFTITPDGQYTYTQLGPIDHADASDDNDIISIKLGIVAEDADGDKTHSFIRIDVADDAPVVLSQVAETVDETNSEIQFGGSTAVTGKFNADIGQDAIDNGYAVNDTFISSGSQTNNTLTSHGVAVTVTSSGNVYTGVAGGVTVFTLTLDTATGDFTYRQFAPLDHADPNDPNDMITLQFGVDVTDYDGDSSDGLVTVNVLDDVPEIFTAIRTVDETNLGSGTVTSTGSLEQFFNNDGVGDAEPTGSFSATGSLENGTLTHNGTAIIVTQTANGYVGVAGGVTVFNLVINGATGEYTFQQFQNLDHGNTNNHNDVISLQFGAEITDYDGDSAVGTITINVRDDGPDARNDSVSISRTGNSASGNVLNNDDAGVDGGALVTTPGTYNGNFGRLTINSDGSYSYTRTNSVAGGTDTFNYTMRDGDGDTDTAQLAVRVTANPPPPPPPPPPIFNNGDGDGGSSSPLVFDLDGDGVEMTTIEDGVLFDIGADGDLDQVAWVKSDDGILAMDVNQDGTINDHSELFGSLEVDGFHILAAADDNQDGVINAEDEIYEDLLIWQDLNQDGVSQEGELTTLSEQGITSINLGAQATDYYLEGSWVAYDSSFTRADGSEGQIADVWFAYIDEDVLAQMVEQIGQEETTEWLSNAYSTVTNFIPSETHENWQEGDPIILGSTHKVFEVGLNDSIVSQNGELTVFYGDDQASDVEGNGSFQVGGSLLNGALTSHGADITVTYDDGTGVYYGSTSENLVFNLQVNQDGSYAFNLFESIDHGNDVNFDDNILLQFGVTVTDTGGDSADGVIRIQVRDAGSYLSGDLEDGVDGDSFSTQDASLFQTIDEAAGTMFDLNGVNDDDILDMALMLESTDDIGEAIQNFVHSQDSGDAAPLNANQNVAPQGVEAIVNGVEMDIPDMVSDVI